MPTERRDDATTAAICAAVIGGALAVGALVLFGGRAAFSVVIGAAIAVANLLTLRAIIRAIVRPPEELERPSAPGGEPSDGEAPHPSDVDAKSAGKRGGAAWGVFAILKIFLLFGGVWVLLAKHLVDPIPLVVGYGVLPLGITASALLSSMRPGRG